MITILTVLFIFTTTLFVWKGVLGQALIGEGPTYFVEPYVSMVENGGLKELWGRHDVQALLFFHYVRDFFYDNMTLYMFVLVCGAFFVAFTVYLIIKKITNSTFFGICGSIFVISNFVGSFEILGLGYYQWFIQRVPNFGIALIGFICMINFTKIKKIQYYFLSLSLYLLAVFLARYTIHILPLFILYLVFNKNRLSRKFLLILPFIVGSYILMKAQSLVQGGDIFIFIRDLSMIPKVFNQVTFLTLPFLMLLPKYVIAGLIKIISPLVFLAYFSIGYFAIRKNAKLMPILLSLLLSVFISVYLSIFLNPYFANFYDTCRYLYYTSILVSLFWVISIHILIKDKLLIKLPFFLFVIVWFFFNNRLISINFEIWKERHDPVVTTIKYISKNKDRFNDGSFVLVSKNLSSYDAGMLDYLYKYKNLDFEPDLIDTKKPEKYIELKYEPLSGNVTRTDH